MPLIALTLRMKGTAMNKDRIRRGDLYRYLASKLFDVPEEDVTPAMRRETKRTCSLLNYGGFKSD